MVGVDPGPFVPVDKGRSGRGLTTRGDWVTAAVHCVGSRRLRFFPRRRKVGPAAGVRSRHRTEPADRSRSWAQALGAAAPGGA